MASAGGWQVQQVLGVGRCSNYGELAGVAGVASAVSWQVQQVLEVGKCAKSAGS